VRVCDAEFQSGGQAPWRFTFNGERENHAACHPVGVLVLIRTTRSVATTEAGCAVAERLFPLLTETRAALQDAANSYEEVRGHLKMNVTGAVMVNILPPLLERFLVLHLNVRVEIMVDDRLLDVTAAGFDAGIRYGENLART
jgi:DNA-binding transcriptional LysR family regulator